MFDVTRVATSPARLEPVRLPLHVALFVPRDAPDVLVFNVPGAVNLLMGSSGWDRATRVMDAKISAPGWSDARLAELVLRRFEQKTPGFPREALKNLRLSEKAEAREIIHAVNLTRVVPKELIALNTRLLILHFSEGAPEREIGRIRQSVEEGGPATIVVHGGTPAGLDRYFLDLYASIIHNRPLTEVARPRFEDEDTPNVHLFIGEGGEEALQFTRWFDEMASLIDRVKSADEQSIRDLTGIDPGMLHARHRDRLKAKIRKVALGRRGLPVETVNRLDELRRKVDWGRETGGVLPMSDLQEEVPYLEATLDAFGTAGSQYPELAQELDDEVQELLKSSPRVLNANFADPGNRTFVSEREPLLEAYDYDLLVDVGPRWSRVPSIVKGNTVFPDKALPPNDDGHVIDVLFFSDDFEAIGGETCESHAGRFRPPVAVAQIWVPADSGRSFPFVNGERLKHPGPVALRVRAPKKKKDDDSYERARGRLSLYYRNNLLQSAAVSVSVGRTSRYLANSNSIDVDYVLSGTFSDIERFSARTLDDPHEAYPVALNITLNDTGGGQHRLMVVGDDDLTRMRPYDPKAAEKILDVARSKLKECFFMRDEHCTVTPAQQHALDANNGKSLEQFKCDLFQLAWYGSDIRADAFAAISDAQAIVYLGKLANALDSRRVIQISRTLHAQYVYPWALVYDIPLPDRSQGALRYCRILDEEWGKGPNASRSGPPAKRCPHADAPEHRVNTICPYGFWGLKHYIEQPINVVPEPKAGEILPPPSSAASIVKLSNPMMFGLGITRDAGLDGKAMQAHLDNIRKVAAAFTPADGADEWEDVKVMLTQPDVAYFLCHGEFDPQLSKPFLSIGPRGGGPQYRVYAKDLFDWAVAQEQAGGFWGTKDRHPLVFINGCHTANLVPGEVLSFVPTFANLGASAVIGTEIDIRFPLAVEVGEKLLRRVLAGEKVGVVMHELRWELANKGNLLGLAYTPYCLSDLTFSH